METLNQSERIYLDEKARLLEVKRVTLKSILETVDEQLRCHDKLAPSARVNGTASSVEPVKNKGGRPRKTT